MPTRTLVAWGLALMLVQVWITSLLVRQAREDSQAICRAAMRRRFGVSREQAEQYIAQEERIWNGR